MLYIWYKKEQKRDLDFEIKDLHLYTIDSPLLNAFAMSRNILGVTKGALDTLEEEDLAGLIAHEYGHFYHKDSQKLAINLGLLVMAQILLYINGVIAVFSSKIGEIHPIIGLFMLIPMFIALIFKLFGCIGIWIYNLIYPILSRKEEYRADRFACELGLGQGMLKVLETIQSYEFKDTTLKSRITQTHPETALRIDEIDKYLAVA